MSFASGDTRGATGGERIAADGPFSFSPEPTLEDIQWKLDEEPSPQAWPHKERLALQEELSDVLIYLVALAACCHVDLPQAVIFKMDTNQRCYPAHLSCDSARKYTDLSHGATTEDQAVGPADLACLVSP
ncbi:dCTP pyrophosphatase 1 [Manis pentadactyla]|uniref:dCTP pyrophosphatase 1 n=1 Tax=Manis pentadactyla TaxID=143292 RepID=UPI00255CE70B|nr:dCTP pyrophosphatase 1 [Manis pentadactyla]KAI5131844.1 Dctp Pyrophosphatase 1 [Manis pentadactyla]